MRAFVFLSFVLVACTSDPEPVITGPTGSGGAGGGAGGGGAGGGPPSPCAQPPRQFWTWDLAVMPPSDVQIAASCRGESEHAYLFVADDTWNAGTMTQAQVDAVLTAFEESTPADASRGIYQTDVDTFGEPPDVDGDPHIVLFYLTMGTFQGYAFDGFFRNVDELDDMTSNRAEMLHLNAAASNEPDSDYMLGVVMHELVHLINHRYDADDEGWLNESLAESAMTLGGYMTDLPAGQQYVKATASTPLCVKSYSSYGATFSWGSYMLDRFGITFLRDVLQDPDSGLLSIEAHLPTDTTMRTAFGEFMVANLLDQPSIGDGRFGYASIDQSALDFESMGTVDGAPHSTDTVAWGARMLRLSPGGAGTLTLQLDSLGWADLVVHTVTFDPARPAAAVIAQQTVAAESSSWLLPIASGEVVTLVVAAAPIDSIESLQNPPKTSFSYTATFVP